MSDASSSRLDEALNPETVVKMKKVVDDFLNSNRISEYERKQLIGCFEIYADESQPELTRWLHGAYILMTIHRIRNQGETRA
jgi:hypothetical protein